MVRTGLDCFLRNFPGELVGKKLGVVCHAASVTASLLHITDELAAHPRATVGAVFGPQHGLFGQTQDNMIEWEGGEEASGGRVPIYSLYGRNRKPAPAMLAPLDALVFDLQDVGARPYTYLWTLKLCMEACGERGIPLYVLDRPNPISAIGFDGPMISPEYYSFVGGAEIPLCYRLTIGEVAQLLQRHFYPAADVSVVWMEGYARKSLFTDTGLPWVLPSPNMPTPDTAVVYPGMVLLEATNLSEGRGTTRPFELFGAPWLDMENFRKRFEAADLPGCAIRNHDFIPTFQKWAGRECRGFQLHVLDRRVFRPVETAAAIILAAAACSGGEFAFRTDPYEYEYARPAIDILTGGDRFRNAVAASGELADLREEWERERQPFVEQFRYLAHYPEGPV
jgi:uncharacterized protein YbbC (DUF1343 family)